MGRTGQATRKRRGTLAEKHQKLVAEYRAEGNEWPVSASKLAQWELDTGRATVSRQTVVQMLAKEIATAMREQMYSDPQGRRVRKLHCFPKLVETPSGMKSQTFLWCDIETANPEEFRAAVKYRRRQMVGDARQLKRDVDSYNENNAAGAMIQLNLDFRTDAIEGGMDTEYNPPPVEE